MRKLGFISFEVTNGKYRGCLSIDTAVTGDTNPDMKIRKALKLYLKYLRKLRLLIAHIEAKRRKREYISARKMWEVGDLIFELKDALAAISLQLDGLYYHLVRDLGVKRKWLEKAIIFRRYIPEANIIPPALNWGKCEKGTRKVALGLANGHRHT
jgi:hypothetical protein